MIDEDRKLIGVKPGQSINRHRPWEKNINVDKSFWDRF